MKYTEHVTSVWCQLCVTNVKRQAINTVLMPETNVHSPHTHTVYHFSVACGSEIEHIKTTCKFHFRYPWTCWLVIMSTSWHFEECLISVIFPAAHFLCFLLKRDRQTLTEMSTNDPYKDKTPKIRPKLIKQHLVSLTTHVFVLCIWPLTQLWPKKSSQPQWPGLHWRWLGLILVLMRRVLVCHVGDVLCPSGVPGFSPNPRAPQ